MVIPAARSRVGSPDSQDDPHSAAAAELIVGAVLLVVATVVGIALIHRSWLHRLDDSGFRLFPAHPESRWARDITHVGSVPVLGAGAAGLCVISGLKRDWS